MLRGKLSMEQELDKICGKQTIFVDEIERNQSKSVGHHDCIIVQSTYNLVRYVLGLPIVLIKASSQNLQIGSEKILHQSHDTYLLDRGHVRKLVTLKEIHTLLSHTKMQRICSFHLFKLRKTG